MRLGAVLPQGEFGDVDGDQIIAFAQHLEAAGYDHLLVYDHVIGADSRTRPDWTGAYDHRDPFLEPLMLFAYLARECALELVTDVLVLPQRQTALVAKQVATLAHLAPGRIRLGVGIGWNEVEYEALGIDFSIRATRLEEQIPLLRELFSSDSVDHAGATDVIPAAGILPRPPVPVPIWVGSGANARGLARAGRLGEGWLPMPQLQPGRGFEPAWVAVQEAATDAGRDLSSFGLEGQVNARSDTLDRVVERARRWHDSGATAIAVNPLRAGARWPDEHLDVLLRAADVLR